MVEPTKLVPVHFRAQIVTKIYAGFSALIFCLSPKVESANQNRFFTMHQIVLLLLVATKHALRFVALVGVKTLDGMPPL